MADYFLYNVIKNIQLCSLLTFTPVLAKNIAAVKSILDTIFEWTDTISVFFCQEVEKQ